MLPVIADEDMEMLFLRIKVVLILASLSMVGKGCVLVPSQIEVEGNLGNECKSLMNGKQQARRRFPLFPYLPNADVFVSLCYFFLCVS